MKQLSVSNFRRCTTKSYINSQTSSDNSKCNISSCIYGGSNIIMKSSMGEILPNTVNGQTRARICLLQYVIFTSIMVVITMITTLLVANINTLQNLLSTWHISLALILFGAVFASVLILVQKVESQFPANYIFLLLTVLTSSCGIAGLTESFHLWTALSWSLAILLAVIAVLVGYKLRPLSRTGDNIMIILAFVLMLLGVILLASVYFSGYKVAAYIVFSVLFGLGLTVALFLTAQVLKLCSQKSRITSLPVKLALITWALIILLYLTISINFPMEE
uniref:Uncharacterized protein n=1 Tax=Trichobilharzia regenti TaxID=157069 RepID=A0AA85J193_TRIRE|nr:unnamed protein product [Trichobilharzia regenti]